ncbi:MAG: CPBP family intramembrane glutamic endopeptidase [Candidatus Caldarchaeales archaeon]
MFKNSVSEALIVWAISMLLLSFSGSIEVQGYVESTIVTHLLLAAPTIGYISLKKEVSETMLKRIRDIRLHHTLLLALAAWAIGSILTLIQDMFYPPPAWYLEEIRQHSPSDFYELMAALLLTWFLVAPVEELLFRWILLRPLIEVSGTMVGVIISAIIFAFSHLDPWNFISPFSVGLAAGWLIAKSRSIISAIIVHSLHNSLSHILNMFITI